MKKLALLLLIAIPTSATLIPATEAVGAFPGTNGRIAYTTQLDGRSTVCAVLPPGGSAYRLTDPYYQQAREPAWSPGGDELLVSMFGTASEERIERMPAFGFGAGGVPVTVGRSPAWSPDGSRIAFVRGISLYTANADGSDEQLLVDGRTIQQSAPSNPAWSPDGSLIAFDDEYRDGTIDNGGIYLVPSGGGEVSFLSGGFEPSWSPDGTEIAARSSFFATAIVAIDVTTGTTRNIVATPSDSGVRFSYPTWAPDGTLVAAAVEGDGTPAIGLFRSDGTGEAMRVETTTPVDDLDWQRILTPATPSTGRAVPCREYPYERKVGLWLSGHLLAEGRVKTLDSQVSCDQFVPVQIIRKKASGKRVFYTRSRRSGRFKLRLPDKNGKYYATIAPDNRTACAGDTSRTRSHRH